MGTLIELERAKIAQDAEEKRMREEIAEFKARLSEEARRERCDTVASVHGERVELTISDCFLRAECLVLCVTSHAQPHSKQVLRASMRRGGVCMYCCEREDGL